VSPRASLRAAIVGCGKIADAHAQQIRRLEGCELVGVCDRERTLLTIYVKLLGKKLVFTAHNVDDVARDGRVGSLTHRWSLGFLYRTADHVFVHSEKVKQELGKRFHVADGKVTVVPLAINDVTPVWSISRSEARHKLGIDADRRILLLFGNIAPYKGVEDAVRALALLAREDPRFLLVIAGPVKNPGCRAYWQGIEQQIVALGLARHARTEVRYIPEDEVGLYFRAADVSLLPYRRVYQSGVLTLSYAQGLPVIAADVGSMADGVRVGETGYLFAPGDPADLAAKAREYFASDLFAELEIRGPKIAAYGAEQFSWAANAERTCAVYETLLR
jgi:glycosyltransferase involved in cell wall biosynthesis